MLIGLPRWRLPVIFESKKNFIVKDINDMSAIVG